MVYGLDMEYRDVMDYEGYIKYRDSMEYRE